MKEYEIELAIFRIIGKRLFDEMPEILKKLSSKDFLKIGASGDKTYPIDQKAEEIIFEELDTYYQRGGRFTLISEEYGFKDFGDISRKILIDPVDGSNNARKGIPFYSTSIALVEGDILKGTRIGYVINLANGEEFWAIKGRGAFMSDYHSREHKKINASAETEINLVLYEAAFPSRDLLKIIPLLKRSNRTRCLGSTALDLSYLAMGACSLLIIPFPSRSFDYAAGWIILKEAGGVTTDLDGNDIGVTAIGVEKTVALVSSANKYIHKKALEFLRRGFERTSNMAHRSTR
jgi:myo-inositol-1(or 4)-monophosphatase